MDLLLEIKNNEFQKTEITSDSLLLTLNSKLNIKDATLITNYKNWKTKI